MINTVKGTSRVCKNKDTGEAYTVSIVDKVLGIAAVGEARASLLACYLGIVNYPGEGELKGICQTARKDLIQDGADRDWAEVHKEVTWSLFVDEGCDGHIPVRG